LFDAAAGLHVASYPGHRDIISGLAFKDGSHTLFSSSFDRTIKVWSVDDGAYGERLSRTLASRSSARPHSMRHFLPICSCMLPMSSRACAMPT
jgi:WD40 repeat protein